METPEQPHINIAGDYSAKGVDIAPDAINEKDFENEADKLGEMREVAPRAPIGGVTKEMAANERAFREAVQASRETASKQMVNPSSEQNVNTDWPVDE